VNLAMAISVFSLEALASAYAQLDPHSRMATCRDDLRAYAPLHAGRRYAAASC
jgi:hypothetical protein